MRQLFLSWERSGFPVIWKPFNFLPAFFAKMLEEKLDFEILLFLDTFCNTNVSDFGTF